MSTTPFPNPMNNVEWQTRVSPGESTPLIANKKVVDAAETAGLLNIPSPSNPSSNGNANGNGNADANANAIKKKKKRGLRLTKDSVSKLQRRVRRTMLKHDLSANFYSHRQFYFFTVPQAFLGLTASFLALATENSTAAGFLSAFAVLVQTLSENCEYATKAAMHQNVALEMGSLREELGYLKDKLDLAKDLGFGEDEMEDMFEDDSDDDDDRNYDFDSIHNRINHALGLCKSNVPLQITDAFLAVESDVKLLRAQKYMKRVKEKQTRGYTKAYREYQNYVHLKAFDLLNAGITNYYFFPLFLPNSEDVVKVVMGTIEERCKPASKRDMMNRKSSYFMRGSIKDKDIENGIDNSLDEYSVDSD